MTATTNEEKTNELERQIVVLQQQYRDLMVRLNILSSVAGESIWERYQRECERAYADGRLMYN